MKNKRNWLFFILLGVLVLFSCAEKKDPTKVDSKIIYTSAEATVQSGGLSVDSGGQSVGDGTKENPYDVHTAFANLQIGDTLKVLPGTYKLSERIYLAQSGDAFNYITVENDSQEKAVFDFSELEFLGTNRGIQLNANYWKFKNLEVTGAGDNGMYIGGSYNIVEDCLFYNNRDSGLQLGRSGGSLELIKDWPSYNVIRNCTAYNNYDDETFGENADGFAAKLTVGYGNIFDGCIAYRNSDDGWDLYAKQDTGNIGTVILYNCVSFENGFTLDKVVEAGVERFVTRDGDGIGFKLGGSTMKGDVIMENCVAFNNRLQGFGDNSNPGVIQLRNCTAFNNNASVDDDGRIDNTLIDSSSEAANFDLARTEDCYNSYSKLLSFVTNKSNNSDRFRGTVDNSVFYKGNNKYTKVDDVIDASSYEQDKMGTEYSAMSTEIFKSVEAVSGLRNATIDSIMRNPDRSIYLGDFLSLKEGELKNSNIGADFDKSSYEEYNHYTFQEPSKTLTEEEIEVLAAYDALQVNCNQEAMFQDMLLPVVFDNCEIKWSSSHEEIISIGTDVIVSLSQSQEIIASVYRPDTDTEVTLTAEITRGEAKMSKTFKINVIKDTPFIGKVFIEGVEDKVIVDQNAEFSLPNVVVTNGASYSDKLLPTKHYTLNYSYKYSESKNSSFSTVSKIDTAMAGVYEVSCKVESTIDKNDFVEFTYTVYVSSTSCEVDFVDGVEVNVNRDGFMVSGNLSNVTGSVYVYSSTNATESVSDIKDKGQKVEFNDDYFRETFNKENNAEYYVHVVVEDKAQEHISDVHSTKVSVVEISSPNGLIDVLSNETDASTIYLITSDLNFNDVNWVTGETTFGGLLNGQGYTLSNITTSSVSLIYKLENGTIMNINFENIKINNADSGLSNTKVGIIGSMFGGYVHNINIKNINVVGGQRIGGVVGQISSGINYLTEISVVNDENYKIEGTRAAAIVGFIQNDSKATELMVNISDCYIKADIGTTGNEYVAGVVGRFDNRVDFMTLSITRIYFDGLIQARNYAGGIIGGFTSGETRIDVTSCMVNFRAVYNSTEFTQSLKNCSPIVGRFANSTTIGMVNVDNNFANYEEYNSEFYFSTYERFEQNIKNELVYSQTLKFDLVNVWIFNQETKEITLR